MYKKITLEVSLKPFRRVDEPFIRKTCAEIFEQWFPLLKKRESVSIMLWIGDGSEILDYNANPDQDFEWAKYIGLANAPLFGPEDEEGIHPNTRKYKYTENPPVMTYGILKHIVSCLKEEGAKKLGHHNITVGSTFDIGPEFAVSDFKYRRHTEICSGYRLGGFGFVDSTSLLHGDDYSYAAYPEGIPEGLPFGTFLGKQTNAFLHDMGMDYLWLSNGLGFSANPWSLNGKVFDGEHFYPEKLAATKEEVFLFWRLFREACPDYPVKVRGTNNSVGIDYATDGVPLYDIYQSDFNITPPPNSPWAALNDDYGLEIMGHMTRICELPGQDFLFRYYLHDPWWANSPWYDRYDGYPSDIYLPMAVSRINKEGKTESATDFHILSIDNSWGDLPDNCVYEPLPHFLKAEKDAPDEPAPFVWVYPMREYTTCSDENTLAEMYYGDNFIRHAINCGFPLNCVVSTDSFADHPLELYQRSILISPVPHSRDVLKKLLYFCELGGKIIFYGSSQRLLELPRNSDCLKEDRVICIDISSEPASLLKAAETFGYSIRFEQRVPEHKPTTSAIARSDNGMFFSVYNFDTTTDTLMKFPLGAPVLLGGETVLENGYARYRFARAEHRECRIFVQQKDGVISAHEAAPTNVKYRRRFCIRGFKDATVCYFPESYCKEDAAAGTADIGVDRTPVMDSRWELIHDPQYGTYYRGEHIDGDYYFYMPAAEYVRPKK